MQSVIRERQAEYYGALAAEKKAGHSTLFIEFLLSALLAALEQGTATDPVTAPVSDPVKALLKVLGRHTLSAAACMEKLGLRHRATFRQNYLQPALDAGQIKRTHPDKPNSRLQKYSEHRQRDG